MKKLLILLVLGAVLYLAIKQDPAILGELVDELSQDGQSIEHAYRQRLSDVQLAGRGRVSRLLKDDNEGSRHQRFILELASGHSLLVAHNIDLAPRINSLRRGDEVGFYGEYEWNQRGGVMHWTHHDPQGRHVAGWLEHGGQRYQ